MTVNDTVMQAVTTPPLLTIELAARRAHLHPALCDGLQGAPFVVTNGSNFNFERDFTIAMTFAASDTGATQGLLYKGTGSAIPAAQTQSSFRVTL